MSLRTRVFFVCFAPFALLLGGSFWAVQRVVEKTVRDGLRSTLRENQVSIARLRSRSDLENSRFLQIAGENASLKAGMQLLTPGNASDGARQTVEDQLGELGQRMGFDLLMVSDANGNPLAAVTRQDLLPAASPKPAASPNRTQGERPGESPASRPLVDTLVPYIGELPHSPDRGLVLVGGRLFQIATVPLDQGDENIGTMSVGEIFDFRQFSTPTILLRDGRPVESSIPGASLDETAAALRHCRANAECEVRLGGADYLSVPLQNLAFGGGFELRSLQDVDSGGGTVQRVLQNVFLASAAGALLLAFGFSATASSTIVQPVLAIVSHLRKSARTGLLPEFPAELSPIAEVRELTESFNRAAAGIREARERLQLAYVEFVGSLASALDARDTYTAGHSRRVSELSCATAEAMGVSEAEVGRIRIGALLHDIGKIGVSDSLLAKPGRLTDEEFGIISRHPVIGRRILEGVHGFTPYLPAVEFHHENWDGSGYPLGQSGEETPLDARIIHVADAYDAMTTDRPYRKGMSHERALAIIRENAGTQFDPEIVAAFGGLRGYSPVKRVSDEGEPESAPMAVL